MKVIYDSRKDIRLTATGSASRYWKRLDRQRDGAMEHPEDTHHVVL